jgi:hypothetical protein
MPRAEIKVAVEVWIAAATLHRKHPRRPSFNATEIFNEVSRLNLSGSIRAGVRPNISLNCVANLAPNTARYRMLCRLSDKTLRLYRPGDPPHPGRTGKTTPDRQDMPPAYWELLDWYEKEYTRPQTEGANGDSWIDRIRGLGKHIWADTTADDWVAELRKG